MKVLATGDVVTLDIQGSTVHELSKVLSDALDYRIRSCTVKLMPIVGSEVAAQLVSIVTNTKQTFSNADGIRDGGGVLKTVHQQHNSTMVAAYDDWHNYSTRGAFLSVAALGASHDIDVSVEVTMTVQLRGRR
jgi:hypothetical protein